MLTKQQVKEILQLNEKKTKAQSLEVYASENIRENDLVFENAVGQDSLTRFDRPRGKRRKKKRRRNTSKKKRSKNA